jgi:hypothetical protein
MMGDFVEFSSSLFAITPTEELSGDIDDTPIPAPAPVSTPDSPYVVVKNVPAAKEYLSSSGWADALIEVFLAEINKVACRYFICDDSGSMLTTDGSHLVKQSNNYS